MQPRTCVSCRMGHACAMDLVMSRPKTRPATASQATETVETRSPPQINIRNIPDDLARKIDAWVARLNDGRRWPISKNAALKAAIEWVIDNNADIEKTGRK